MTNIPPILIISSSSGLAELFSQWREHNISCITVPDIEQGLPLLHRPEFSLVIVDSPKPGDLKMLEGLPQIPLILLCDNTMPETTMSEYMWSLKKPVDIHALFDLVDHNLATTPSPIMLGRLYFSLQERFLSESEKPSTEAHMLKLTEKEAAVLHYLYTHQGKAVDKETLLSDVWGYHPDIDTHTLETHIYRLRQKISDYFKEDIILTEPGGYVLK